MKSLKLALFVAMVFALGRPCHSAATDCPGDLSPVDLEMSQERPVSFPSVEVFRRNNDLGLQQFGDLKFVKWLVLGPDTNEMQNFVGLTEDGRLFHLVHWRNRTIARPLNGQRIFREFFWLGGEVLLGVDEAHRVYVYSPELWNRSPLLSSLRRGGLIWLGTNLLTLGAVAATSPDALGWSLDVAGVPVPLVGGFVAVTSGIVGSLTTLNFQQNLNTFPDGFVALPFYLESRDQLRDKLLNVDLTHYHSRDHFRPPELSQLPPPTPELSVEEIH